MSRTALLITLLFLAVSASGCLDDQADEPTQDLDAEETTRTSADEPRIEPAGTAPITGTTRIREVSVCTFEGGCPVIGGRFGYWAWDVDGTFQATPDTTGADVEITWEAAHPGLETLHVFVYEGDLGSYHVLSEATSTSPVTLHVDAETLAEHDGELHVGFTGDDSATVILDQEVDWVAQLLTD